MRKLYVRAVKRRRFFTHYAKKSLKKAAASAFVGFVSALIVGLQTGQVVSVTIVIACLTAIANFIREVFM